MLSVLKTAHFWIYKILQTLATRQKNTAFAYLLSAFSACVRVCIALVRVVVGLRTIWIRGVARCDVRAVFGDVAVYRVTATGTPAFSKSTDGKSAGYQQHNNKFSHKNTLMTVFYAGFMVHVAAVFVGASRVGDSQA